MEDTLIMRRRLWLLVPVLAFSACGGGGETSGSAPPDELLGTYSTTLTKADLPAAPPPELATGLGGWTLTIADKGGPDGGPALSIVQERLGNLESPSLRVDGDRLLLHHEECAAGGTEKFYDNEYRWKLGASGLRITTVENQCPDRVAETILTSHPWAKSG